VECNDLLFFGNALMTRSMTAAFLMLLPSIAFAQASVDLSDYQVKANDNGVRALIAGDFPSALANFQSSLRLGEANITWLNLGRTYQKMGQCLDAKDAYSNAKTAPVVSSPTAEEIATIVKTYSDELPAECPSSVKIECAEGVENPVLNGVSVLCGATVVSDAGPIHITAEHAQELSAQDLTPGESRVLNLAYLEPAAAHPDIVKEPAPPSPADGLSGLQTTGLILAGVGVATLGAAIILDATWVKTAVDDSNTAGTQDSFDEAEGRQFANKVLIFSGVALAVGGGVLYLLSPDETQISLWITPTIDGAALGGIF
jgi:hypothetical protein